MPDLSKCFLDHTALLHELMHLKKEPSIQNIRNLTSTMKRQEYTVYIKL